jgi:hypothetical protein
VVGQTPKGWNQQRGGLLQNNRALCVGGTTGDTAVWQPGGSVDQQLIYDYATNTCGFTGKMKIPRIEHSFTQLTDGRVLIAGGQPWGYVATVAQQAEIFEPEANVYISYEDPFIPVGMSYQFGVEYNGSVTWSTTQGTISNAGLWSVPWNPAGSTATITATSTTDSSKFAYVPVKFLAADKVVVISPVTGASVNTDIQLTATVARALENNNVTWQITSGAGATVSNGIFHSTQAGTYTVKATSVVDDRYNTSVTFTVQ